MTRILSFDRALAAPVLAAALFSLSAWADAPPKMLSVKVGAHPLRVEVADTAEKRTKGLMFREKLGKNDGMLFYFDEPGYHSMWMMNTLHPALGRLPRRARAGSSTSSTWSRAPRTRTPPPGPARYAIETNKGWFAEKKIKAGDKVTGLPKF